MQERYTEELRKIHGPDIEDSRLVPFNIDATYAVGGGTCHTRLLRPKPDAHRMYAQDQVVTHTVRM
jgi:hypothetical protein